MASGINNTFRQVGIATGIAGLGAIFQSKVHGADRASFVSGLNAILLVAAFVAFFGALAGGRARARRATSSDRSSNRRTRPEAQDELPGRRAAGSRRRR